MNSIELLKEKDIIYRVNLVVVDLGLIDFDLDDPSFCPNAQPVLPNSHLPKQNWAGSGMTKFKVNPNHVHDHLCEGFSVLVKPVFDCELQIKQFK